MTTYNHEKEAAEALNIQRVERITLHRKEHLFKFEPHLQDTSRHTFDNKISKLYLIRGCKITRQTVKFVSHSVICYLLRFPNEDCVCHSHTVLICMMKNRNTAAIQLVIS